MLGLEDHVYKWLVNLETNMKQKKTVAYTKIISNDFLLRFELCKESIS